MSRAKWCTSQKISEWYDMMADALVNSGIATRNPDYNPTAQSGSACEPIFIVDPDRWISYDETRLELDMTQATKAKSERTVVNKLEPKDSRRDCLSYKGGLFGTGIGGSTASAKALRPMFVFGSGSFALEWTMWRPPRCDFIDPDTGRMFRPKYICNKKGGVDDDMGVMYLRDVVLPLYPTLTEQKPLVMTCDGHGSHLTTELIEFARANHVVILLRVPHTSHKLQGEDVANYSRLKGLVRKRKTKVLQEVYKQSGTLTLGAKHFMPIMQPCWDESFTQVNNARGWALTGLYPFTRHVYWKLKHEEETAATAQQNGGLNWNHLNQLFPGANNEVNELDLGREEYLAALPDEDRAACVSLMDKRITSAEVYSLGPITDLATLQLLKAKQEKRDEAQARLAARKQSRSNKLQVLQRLMIASASQLVVETEADLDRLTVTQLHAWMLTREPGKYEQHKKIVGKPQILAYAKSLLSS